jgi:hypothetical protein
MGFFSFLTQDNKKSIANRFSRKKTFVVHLIDDKGNVFTEFNYSGYGIFGGKDIFELIAEMNGKGKNRNKGINLFYDENAKNVKFPNIVQNLKKWKYKNEAPEECPNQGYFY